MSTTRKTERARLILRALKKPEKFEIQWRLDKWVVFPHFVRGEEARVGYSISTRTAEQLHVNGVEIAG